MQSEQETVSQEEDKRDKRKRSEQSSTSELDNSTIDTTDSKQKTKKKAKKMAKPEPTIQEYFATSSAEKHIKGEMKEIRLQLKEVNLKLSSVISKVDKSDQKLENVIVKDDGTLRTILRDMMSEMKEELLNSVINRLEILEKKVYDKDEKNDELKTEVKRLETKVTTQTQENDRLHKQIENMDETLTRNRNDAEQYSRINNLRIHGIPSRNNFEPAEETTYNVMKTLKDKMDIEVRREDIDIAHRIKQNAGQNTDILVRFQSRLVKDNVLMKRRTLKGTGIYINEDLTKLNQQVFMSIKRKMPDEVNAVFTRNGVIKYITMTNQTKTVLFPEYQHWLDLPWPTRGSPTQRPRQERPDRI